MRFLAGSTITTRGRLNREQLSKLFFHEVCSTKATPIEACSLLDYFYSKELDPSCRHIFCYILQILLSSFLATAFNHVTRRATSFNLPGTTCTLELVTNLMLPVSVCHPSDYV